MDDCDALLDLRRDCGEIVYISYDFMGKLRRFSARCRTFGLEKAHPSVLEMGFVLEDKLASVRSGAEALQKTSDPVAMEKGIADLRGELRSLVGLVGSLLVSVDWESPAFAASSGVPAGVQIGRIKATLSDYKRDHHFDEERYEEAFAREYVGVIEPFLNCYLTVSGMAAATTALLYLRERLADIGGTVMLGSRSYFELKDIANGLFAGNIVEFDESDADRALHLFEEKQAGALILDTFSNTLDVVRPDTRKLIGWFNRPATKQAFVLLDNTSLSLGISIPKILRLKRPGLTVVGVESLNKFYQFGMDRVTAGVVWGWGGNSGRLFSLRDRLGTNIPDASVHALVTPNREMMLHRLKRLGGNTEWLASELAAFVADGNCAVRSINYPGLKDRGDDFSGAFFTLGFAPAYANVKTYRRFVDTVIAEAKKRRVQLVGGTSFGFDATRVYLTALNTDCTVPFVRIAPGTESRSKRILLRDACIAAIRSLS